MRGRVALLTALAMLAFAGNSLLCRAALRETAIDAATFTSIRIVSGAIALWLIVRMRGAGTREGSWPSAFWLFAYAAAFSFAYVTLTAATGALLLPGVSAPPLPGAVLMIGAGVAWGFYSLRGRGAGDPTRVTAGNFLRAAPMALAVSVATASYFSVDAAGVAYAVASGAITSGVGYAIWYTALPSLKATVAATVQLSVPVIAAMGGVLLLGEALTLRLVLCSIAILGGIALVVRRR